MKEVKEKKNRFGLSYMIFALLFLFNPNFHLIDPLPDFIGYIFLCLAFSKMADLNDDIADAVSLFRKLIWMDAGKWLALFLTLSMSASLEKNSSILLWTFVFATLELIFGIPAYIKLFDGITKLGYFHPNTAILGVVKKKRSATDRAKKATIAFLCIKAGFTVLPELLDLSNDSYMGLQESMSLYRYVGLLRGFSVIVVLIFGMIWLCRLQRYFSRLRHDTVFLSSLAEAYQTNVQPKVGIFIYRRFRLTCVFFVLALIFSLDYSVDGITFFPDVLSALAIFFAFFTLSRYASVKKMPGMILSIAYFLMSVVTSVQQENFFAEHSYSALIKNDAALRLYSTYVICNALKTVIFIVALFFAVSAFRKIIAEHTGTVIGREYVDDRVIAMEKALHKELRRPLFFGFGFGIAYGVSDICYDIFAPMLSQIYVKQDVIHDTITNLEDHYGWIKTINVVLLILCVAIFVRAILLIFSEIKNKYELE